MEQDMGGEAETYYGGEFDDLAFVEELAQPGKGSVGDGDAAGHLVRVDEHGPLGLGEGSGLAGGRCKQLIVAVEREGAIELGHVEAGGRDAGLSGQRGVVAPFVPGMVDDGDATYGELAQVSCQSRRLRAHRPQKGVPAIGDGGRVQQRQPAALAEAPPPIFGYLCGGRAFPANALKEYRLAVVSSIENK
ncbi:hypothetical protein CMQ_1062 [Grosmannia clavigera kw1407]|uniref:Uncharacterized protein n=1 Tax=Grosmannia clavigera (strain kw1407 / UAMH 11150) TaxID=655863 RepID=F0XCN8_GROCL|nr:uncharacterized protein CMQ_1062 [Grosmannia clavigera kw1407]EFX04134.1 hypothetical protein CMQ_1062 [Grosmannia clavigera kw1407]